MSLAPQLARARWDTAALGYLVKARYGYPFASETFNADGVGVAVVRIRDVLPNRVQTWADETPPSSAWIDDGDLVIGMDGDFNHVLWGGGRAVLNQRVCALDPGPRIDSRFLAYVIVFPLSAINDIVHFTTVKHLSFSDLLAEQIPVPPLQVQRRIADYLDTETSRIDRLIARNSELRLLARERHERHVLAAVTRGRSRSSTVPTGGPDWCDDVGQGFTIGPYAMYGRTGSGHTPSRTVDEYWVNCNTPWVTTGDVKHLRDGFVETLDDTEHKISRLGLANSAARLHPAGTVFLSRTASVGFAGIMAVPMATSQDFFTWTPDGRLRSDYLLWSLRAMRYAGHFDRLMYGSTHKTIYVPDLLGLRGPIPPIETQDAIVATIREQRDGTVRLLKRLDHANQLLAERRQALITAAVTGELEV